jgi:hypothetical protein
VHQPRRLAPDVAVLRVRVPCMCIYRTN